HNVGGRWHHCLQRPLIGDAPAIVARGDVRHSTDRSVMAHKSRAGRGSMPLTELLEAKESKAMASFGVRDLDAMMRFAPRRYTTLAPLRSLHQIHEGEEMSAIVTVVSVRDRAMRSRRGHILEAVVTDGTDELPLTF